MLIWDDTGLSLDNPHAGEKNSQLVEFRDEYNNIAMSDSNSMPKDNIHEFYSDEGITSQQKLEHNNED